MPIHKLCVLLVPAALAISGCSTATSGVTTGSIASPASQVAAPQRPEERTSKVASIAARAEKCGYNFDPQRLRASYMAYETSGGIQADQLAGISRLYDMTKLTVAARIKDDTDFCTDASTREIRAELQRHLTGDFSTPQKPVVAQTTGGSGWFGFGSSGSDPRQREVLDPEWMRDRNGNKTKRVE